jgi:hypothetical protein
VTARGAGPECAEEQAARSRAFRRGARSRSFSGLVSLGPVCRRGVSAGVTSCSRCAGQRRTAAVDAHL